MYQNFIFDLYGTDTVFRTLYVEKGMQPFYSSSG